ADTLFIDLASQANQLAMKVADVEIYSKLIEAEYPPYERIMPTEFTTEITIDQQALSQAVKMAGIFAREAGSLVKLQIEPEKQQATVMAQSASIGQNHSTIPLEGSGEDVIIA